MAEAAVGVLVGSEEFEDDAGGTAAEVEGELGCVDGTGVAEDVGGGTVDGVGDGVGGCVGHGGPLGESSPGKGCGVEGGRFDGE